MIPNKKFKMQTFDTKMIVDMVNNEVVYVACMVRDIIQSRHLDAVWEASDSQPRHLYSPARTLVSRFLTPSHLLAMFCLNDLPKNGFEMDC